MIPLFTYALLGPVPNPLVTSHGENMKKPAKKRASNPGSHAENSRDRVPQQARRKQAGRQKASGPATGMERLRATIEASVDCVITIDAQSTILEFNAAAERTFGYAREDVIGKPLPEMIIPPSLREAHRKGMAALLKGGTSKLLGRRVEMPAMRSDSSEFPVELTITRIDSQKPPLFTAYLRDITERKQAQEELRKSEKLFTAFMDHLPGYAWIKDMEGRYVYVNETFLQLRNAVGKTDAELWPELASTYRANDNHVIQTKNTLQTIEPFPRDPDQGCQIVSKFPIFDQDGAVVMVGGASVEISELIQAEKALEVQALRYKTLMETSTDSIYVLDAEGNLLEANAAFLRQRGYTAAEVTGLNVADWDVRWTRTELQKRFRELAGSSDVFETRHRCKDGSLFDVEVNAASVRIGGKHLFFCVTRDITGRKKAERALRESETRFRQVAENINEVFWLADPEATLIHYVSPAYEKIWGRSCDSLYAEPSSWMDSIHPDDRERIAEGVRLQLVRGQHDHTYRIVRPDGSLRWIRDRAFPVRDAAGKLIRIAGIAEDITERRSAEEELKKEKEILAKVFNNIPVMIGFVGADGGVKLVNPEWERTIGWTVKELEEQKVDIFAEAYPDLSYRQEVLDFVAASTGEWADLKIKVRDGRMIDAACAVVHLSDGTKVAIAQDITERKRAAKELEEANHQLRFLSRRLFEVQEGERRHLARELHDEIGQALTAAKINLQSVTGNGGCANSARLQETTAILDRLLGQVRQISLDLRPSMLDDLGLVPALRSLLDQQGRTASMAVRFSAENIPENLDPEIQTTCFRIAQEAITNTLRHAHATQLNVDLRRENGKLGLLIRDNGTGFDAESAQARAVGLGLIGIRERAALIGGRAKIISSPNKGTTVEVFLPLTLRPQRRGRHLGK
jgi:PAS domain S-box-containing protein